MEKKAIAYGDVAKACEEAVRVAEQAGEDDDDVGGDGDAVFDDQEEDESWRDVGPGEAATTAAAVAAATTVASASRRTTMTSARTTLPPVRCAPLSLNRSKLGDSAWLLLSAVSGQTKSLRVGMLHSALRSLVEERGDAGRPASVVRDRAIVEASIPHLHRLDKATRESQSNRVASCCFVADRSKL